MPGVADELDLGPIEPARGGGWVLNPESTLPLSVCSVGKGIAEEFRTLLKQNAPAHEVLAFVIRTNLRCREVEDYTATFRPVYLSKIDELKASSAEWASSSALDREDLLATFARTAIACLPVRPYCDLRSLFESEEDLTVDDALVDRFGYDCLRVYFEHASALRRVHAIRSDHRDRATFERLEEMGLALRGADIPAVDILADLTLKAMAELAADVHPQPFTRKASAVSTLASLPDIDGRLAGVVALRTLFELNPLPKEFSTVDIQRVMSSWRYASQVAALLRRTFFAGDYAANWDTQIESDAGFASRWKMLFANDACPLCMEASSKGLPAGEHPVAPLHIGRRCSVLLGLGDG